MRFESAQSVQSAEAHLGHPITEAVITVPAYFNDSQRSVHDGMVSLVSVKSEGKYGFFGMEPPKVLSFFGDGQSIFKGLLGVH